MTTDAQVKLIIADVSGFDVSDIQYGAILTLDLELDSLDLANLAVELESQLDVKIPDSAVSANMTVRELVDTIGKLLSGNQPATK